MNCRRSRVWVLAVVQVPDDWSSGRNLVLLCGSNELVIVRRESHVPESAGVQIDVVRVREAPVQKPAMGYCDVEIYGLARDSRYTKGTVSDVRRVGGVVRMVKGLMGDVMLAALGETLLAAFGDL